MEALGEVAAEGGEELEGLLVLDALGDELEAEGERIPLGSRIIAVCDAFTAMTAVRP